METIKPEIPVDSPVASSLARRHGLLAAVAGVAVVTGALFAWRQGGFGAQPRQAQAHFWDSSFLTPGGAPLAMASFRGQPLILNFWATWCPPCIEEFHLLDVFYKENVSKSWQILGLALDQPLAVQRFLVQSPVAFAIAMAGLEGAELSKSLGNATGGLPFTVVFGTDGKIVQRKIGQLTKQDLQTWRDMIR